MGTFDFCCGLLVPLYAARATEVMLFGTEGATLATANEVCWTSQDWFRGYIFRARIRARAGARARAKYRASLPQCCCALARVRECTDGQLKNRTRHRVVRQPGPDASALGQHCSQTKHDQSLTSRHPPDVLAVDRPYASIWRRINAQVARAGDLAHWLVRSSTLHPAFRGTTLLWDMRMGGYPDPTVRRLEKQFEGFTVALQRAAYRRALALVAARRPVIETVAEELLDGSRSGFRLNKVDF